MKSIGIPNLFSNFVFLSSICLYFILVSITKSSVYLIPLEYFTVSLSLFRPILIFHFCILYSFHRHIQFHLHFVSQLRISLSQDAEIQVPTRTSWSHLSRHQRRGPPAWREATRSFRRRYRRKWSLLTHNWSADAYNYIFHITSDHYLQVQTLRPLKMRKS